MVYCNRRVYPDDIRVFPEAGRSVFSHPQRGTQRSDHYRIRHDPDQRDQDDLQSRLQREKYSRDGTDFRIRHGRIRTPGGCRTASVGTAVHL